MKKFLLPLLIIMFLLPSCKKEYEDCELVHLSVIGMYKSKRKILQEKYTNGQITYDEFRTELNATAAREI